MSERGSVVITGAGGGIGRALAIGFAGDGYDVVGFGRSLSSLEGTAGLCAAGRFTFHTVDVSDSEAVAAALEAAALRNGNITALICNAAVYPRDYFLDQPAEDWARALLINVCGVANCCRVVLPGMLERGYGRIVVLGSLADMTPIPSASVYSVSKGAVHVLVRAIAAEIDRGRFPNVLVNEFNPGPTRSGMNDQGDDPSVAYARVRRLIDLPSGGPTGRMYVRDKEFHTNRSPKAQIRRLLNRLLGRG